jgi:hypothetical protein
MIHVPKGSMCANCLRAREQCNHFDFDAMPVVSRHKDLIVVRCTMYEKDLNAKTIKALCGAESDGQRGSK